MKTLAVSLVFVVVLAVLGIGQLVSEFSGYLNKGALETPEFENHIAIGSALAGMLDQLPQSDLVILFAEQAQDIDPAFKLLDATEFPVSDSILMAFRDGEPLILESEIGLTINFYLKQADKILVLTIPPGPSITPSGFLQNLALTLVFYVGVIAAVSIWLYPLMRNLANIRTMAQRFGNGDLSARIAKTPLSYTADIEREFNAMAHRIELLVADNKLLSQAVSHELKTPLSRLRFGFETWAESKNPAARLHYLQRIDGDIMEMEKLVDRLLQYSKLDESNLHLEWTHIELVSFLQDLANVAESDGKCIECCSRQEILSVVSDCTFLTLQINNILSNAIRHAVACVRITANEFDAGICISIEDDGPGVRESERDMVMQPFWRGHELTPYNGHGMGLAIVARLSERLGNSFEIGSSAELGGAKVTLFFANRIQYGFKVGEQPGRSLNK